MSARGHTTSKEQSSEASLPCSGACVSVRRAWISRSRDTCYLLAAGGGAQFPVSCLTHPLSEMQKCLSIPSGQRLLLSLAFEKAGTRRQSMLFPVWSLCFTLSQMENGFTVEQNGPQRLTALHPQTCLRPLGREAK